MVTISRRVSVVSDTDCASEFGREWVLGRLRIKRVNGYIARVVRGHFEERVSALKQENPSVD